jgi:hypothetical protein
MVFRIAVWSDYEICVQIENQRYTIQCTLEKLIESWDRSLATPMRISKFVCLISGVLAIIRVWQVCTSSFRSYISRVEFLEHA